MICPTGKVENIFGWGWTGQISLNGFKKFGFWRTPEGPDFVPILFRPPLIR
jgi:hypothetical protein